MPVTAKDIARELNLSQPTVSRILSGDQRQRASEATRQRVLEAAKRVHYQPNAVARSLRQGRTHIVGLYTHYNYDVRNDFLGAIIGSLQRTCASQGLDLLLHSALHGGCAEDIYGRLRDGRIDGLILHASPDDALVGLLGESPLPVVVIADRLPNLPSVTCDDSAGMRQMIGFLWERGHRRFAFLAPQRSLTSVERRRAAFLAALTERGLPAEDRAVLDIDYEEVEAALADLRRGGQPIAACCWNDRAAYNLLRACLEQGVRVPEEVAVIGFDGFLDDKIPARRLVTVRCPWAEVAVQALDTLTHLIEGRKTKNNLVFPTQETSLPVSLVEGDTA